MRHMFCSYCNAPIELHDGAPPGHTLVCVACDTRHVMQVDGTYKAQRKVQYAAPAYMHRIETGDTLTLRFREGRRTGVLPVVVSLITVGALAYYNLRHLQPEGGADATALGALVTDPIFALVAVAVTYQLLVFAFTSTVLRATRNGDLEAFQTPFPTFLRYRRKVEDLHQFYVGGTQEQENTRRRAYRVYASGLDGIQSFGPTFSNPLAPKWIEQELELFLGIDDEEGYDHLGDIVA